MARLQKEALDIETRTQDAYSFPRYRNWGACADMLLKRGYTVQQTETILRSKIMRWAADHSRQPYGRVTSKALATFIDNNKNTVQELFTE